jgi:hypothetical protein
MKNNFDEKSIKLGKKMKNCNQSFSTENLEVFNEKGNLNLKWINLLI